MESSPSSSSAVSFSTQLLHRSNALYQPLSESGSADFIYTPPPVVANFQLKDGAQIITKKMIGTELAKTPYKYLSAPYTKLILIIIGFNVHESIQQGILKFKYITFKK